MDIDVNKRILKIYFTHDFIDKKRVVKPILTLELDKLTKELRIFYDQEREKVSKDFYNFIKTLNGLNRKKIDEDPDGVFDYLVARFQNQLYTTSEISTDAILRRLNQSENTQSRRH